MKSGKNTLRGKAKSRGKGGLKMPRMNEQEKRIKKEERESERNERMEIIRQKTRQRVRDVSR